MTDEVRKDALDAFLDDRTAEGFRIESRSDTQAIIARPRRVLGLLDKFRGAGRDDSRQVVSVDEHGVVTARPAEPIRW